VGEGVRQAEISRLERDHVTLPRRSRLEQIADALEIPLGVLLARSGWVGAHEELDLAAELAASERPETAPTRPKPPEVKPMEATMYEDLRANLVRDVPQLTDAISRARELTQHTETVIRDAQETYNRARSSTLKRRKSLPQAPADDMA
jgi:transcriptional regulator with XRE-family HTH domain